MLAGLHLLRSEAARRFGRTIIDPDWRPSDGPMPFIRIYGPLIVAFDVAIILAVIIRDVLL